MNQFLQMDVFFVVTTTVVIVLGILVALVLMRVYRILGNLEEISEMVSQEGRDVRAHIARLVRWISRPSRKPKGR